MPGARAYYIAMQSRVHVREPKDPSSEGDCASPGASQLISINGPCVGAAEI